MSWIICDGDIDPKWIESLNSVLDDNHLLTLPTGERINFGNNVNFIFETDHLKFASPATVSRMGMIFLNNEDINIQSLLNKWLNSQPEKVKKCIDNWISLYFNQIFKWVINNEELLIVKTTRVGLIMNVLSMLKGVTKKQNFIIAMLRGFAANFPQDKRIELA